MKKQPRLLALLLAALLVLVMASSVGYIAAEADHDCIGEHCQICQQMAACENTLKLLSFGAAAVAVAVALTSVLCSAVSCAEAEASRYTLITLKVKLSN